MNRKALSNRAKKIKLLAMDVDGVLTGGEIIILNSGEEVKIWSVKDRMGFALLKNSGCSVKLAWLTARKSQQVKKRAEDIGVDFLYQKCLDKWKSLGICAEKMGISAEEIAYIGDDLVDLPSLKRVGFSVCPPESPEILKKHCHYQTKTPSGRGVVREVIEILLKAQGHWKRATSRFLIYAVLLAVSLSACSTAQKPPLDSAEKPDEWVEKFTITGTLTGVPVWILNSEIAKIYNKQNKVILENISIQFMNPSPAKKKQSRKSLMIAKKSVTQAARLSAPFGEVKKDNQNLSAWGGVEVQSDDGTTLLTERLHYSTSRQKISTESPVKIFRRGSILIGEGLEASPDLSTVKIFRHRAEIFPRTMR